MTRIPTMIPQMTKDEIKKPYDTMEDDCLAEPEANLELPHHSLGRGKVIETHVLGQVNDAQGESYYRRHGCDVYL